jgi:hypothetical protein
MKRREIDKLWLGLMLAWVGVQAPMAAHAQGGDSEELQTVDYLVPHISTVPANAGKRVELFVSRVPGRRGHTGEELGASRWFVAQ